METANIPQAQRCQEYILAVALEQKRSIMGYHGDAVTPFLRITTALPKHVPTVRKILESSFSMPGYPDRQVGGGGTAFFSSLPTHCASQYLTYESNLLFVLRFMVDTGVVGGGWISLPQGAWSHVNDPQSHCQIEVNIAYNKLRAYSIDERGDIAPLRVMSFDIECAGRKGIFPGERVVVAPPPPPPDGSQIPSTTP